MAAKIGWILSAVILVGLLAILTWVLWPPQTVGTQTALTLGMDKTRVIRMDLDMEKLVSPPSGTGAEAAYEECVRDAFKTLKPGEKPFHFFERVRDQAANDPLKVDDLRPIVAKLLKAGQMGMDPKTELVFAELPMQATTDKGNELFLRGLGHLLDKTAVSYMKEDNYPKAIETYKATALFGWRLWQNGVYAATRTAGLAALGDGIAGLKWAYEKSGAADNLAMIKEMQQIKETASRTWWDKLSWTRSISDQGKIGDLAYLALHDQDRTWRIQGAMWLGIAKRTRAGPKLRARIDAFLEAQMKAKDPLVAAAAKTARAVSKEDIEQFDARPFNY